MNANLTDVELKEQIEQEFLNDDRLSAHNIQVEVDNRTVTLRGSVNSFRESLLAVDIVGQYPEVGDIVNLLDIKPMPDLSDEEIELNIRNTFKASADVTSETITIASRGGKVTLSGYVGSYWERTIAAELAKGVTGVTEVENLLVVDLYEKIEDEELCNAIKAELARTRGLEKCDIQVAVADGVVELNGQVDHFWQKELAHDAVRRFSVTRVDNEIVVR